MLYFVENKLLTIGEENDSAIAIFHDLPDHVYGRINFRLAKFEINRIKDTYLFVEEHP
jgi:hypothetical protein